MIIFLYGPDDYRREAKKREIVAEFRNKQSNLGLGFFDLLEEGGLGRFLDFLANQSIFASKKLAVLSSAFEVNPKELAQILKEVSDSKDITVLISEPVRQAQGKNFEFLKKKSVLSQEFEFLEGRGWESFILEEAKRLEVKITPTALRFLAGVYQNNTWALVTGLEKIGSLGKEEIDVKDLGDLGVEQAPNFWSLILSFRSRNLPDRLRALEKIFGTNEPPAKIFNILAYQLPDRLQDLANYDLTVKSGKMEYEEALLNLAIK